MKDLPNRRAFLRSTDVPSDGVSFASPKPSDYEINIAVIGLGQQGNRLIDSCRGISCVNIQALCDIWQYNLDKAAHKLRLRNWFSNSCRIPEAYKDYRRMLDTEKNLDAVIIATPDFCHEQQTIDCLNAGLDVYCEKPMASTPESARRMVQAQKQTGKLLQIGCQRRSNPKYNYIKNKLIDRENLLGRITAINSKWCQSVAPDVIAPNAEQLDTHSLKRYGYKNMHRFLNWRWFRELSAGPVANLASQQIDVFNWFLNANPTAVTASGGTDYYNKDTRQCRDNVMAILEYDTKQGKVRASQQVIKTNGAFEHFESFLGLDGTLTISELNKGGIHPERFARLEVRKRWDKYLSSKKTLLVSPNGFGSDESAQNYITVNKSDEENEIFWGWVMSSSPLPGEEIYPSTFPLFGFPAVIHQRPHAPHLRNFFEAVAGRAELNCSAEVAYSSAVLAHKINQAIEAGKTLTIDPKEFKA